MRKQTIQYGSRVDALVAVSKRLSQYETRYGLESEEFFNRYSGGRMADEADFGLFGNLRGKIFHLEQSFTVFLLHCNTLLLNNIPVCFVVLRYKYI